MDVRIDLAGRSFGRLTVLGFADKRGRKLYWFCRCECGTVKTVHGDHMKAGKVRSCGCLNREVQRLSFTKHGGAAFDKTKRHPLYSAWCDMKKRCGNPNATAYEYYGGRGISVCAEWISDFQRFCDDVGLKPSRGHSLDRIDNDGNYEPSNVRWATKSQQMLNRRTWKIQRPVAASSNSPSLI